MKRANRLIAKILCLTLMLSCMVGCVDTDNTSPTEETNMSTEPTTLPTESIATEATIPTDATIVPTETQATEPTVTEPQPTETQATEPKPTETQPTEPKPTEPQPTEPAKKGYLSQSDTTIAPVRTLEEIKNSLRPDDLRCDQFDLSKYTLPFWEGNIVYNESITFYRDTTGRAAAPLLYDVAEIISVKSSDLKTTYVEGVDYVIENGMLVLTPNSSIPCFAYSDLYFNNNKPGWSWELKKGGYTLFQEGTYFHQRQVAVTYLHTEPWTGYKPAYQESMLPKIISKLKAGEDVTIVYLGDSITKGGNASGMFGAAPNMPIWTDMVTTMLKRAYPNAKITTYSASENGATTDQAIKNLRQLCSNHKPDLVVIGFGMNDGSDSKITPDRFQENIEYIMMMNDLLTGKSCDYLLLATTLPNQEVKLGDANTQGEHSAKLFELEKQGTATTGGVVVADMTAIHSYLLESKRFIDMTANNINHPNDFLVRAYAQVVCTMLIE